MQQKRKNKPGAGRPVTGWTPDRVKILKKLYPVTDNQVIADKLGMTVSAIRNAAIRFGVTKKGWTEKEVAVIRASFNSLTYQQIADKIGKTKWSVINKARELKLTPINNFK